MNNSIKSLELIHALEKNNLKSKEDCLVIAFHCFFLNHQFRCVGIGDEWPESDTAATSERLPSDWNSNQDVYSLRYISSNGKSHILVKFTKMEHILQVDVVKDDEAVASMSAPSANYVRDDYREFSSAYHDLEPLSQSFHKDVIQNLLSAKKSPDRLKRSPSSPSASVAGPMPSGPSRPAGPRVDLRQERNPYYYPRLPRVGGQDLDPFGGNGGGMLMDPSSFGIPGRPTLPEFGVGGPGGLPRGAVPPGARFDPFMPPIFPGVRNPNPDHFGPPDFEDFM